MFGKFGEMAELVRKAQALQDELAKAKEEIPRIEASGKSEDGLVEAVAAGDFTVKTIHIRQECLATKDPAAVGASVLSAVNAALSSAKQKAKEKIYSVTAGLNIPDMPF